MRKHLFSLGVLLAALGYAVLRYNVFKGVSHEQLPLYITNKAASWAGLILIGASPFFRTGSERAYVGVFGGVLVAIHLIASLMMFQPTYFPKYFRPDQFLTWQIELSMLAGTVATVAVGILMMATFSSRPPDAASAHNRYAGFGRATLFLTAVHVLCMGYAGWFDVTHWPGWLPPITLLSFLCALGFLSARIITVGQRRFHLLSRNGTNTTNNHNDTVTPRFRRENQER